MKTENLGNGLMVSFLPPNHVKIYCLKNNYEIGNHITLSLDMVQTIINYIHIWQTENTGKETHHVQNN